MTCRILGNVVPPKFSGIRACNLALKIPTWVCCTLSSIAILTEVLAGEKFKWRNLQILTYIFPKRNGYWLCYGCSNIFYGQNKPSAEL